MTDQAHAPERAPIALWVVILAAWAVHVAICIAIGYWLATR